MATTNKKTKKAALTKKAPVVKEVTQKVGVRELRQSASQVLDQVKNGTVFEITEHGVPVARLVPITKSLYEEYLESHRIIPARDPGRVFTLPKGTITEGRQLSKILIEERGLESL